jgi:hypothetical protein
MNIDEFSSINKANNNLEEKGEEKDLINQAEEDETLVVLQFTDIDDANYCQQFYQNKFKTLDISGKNPIIQIGNRLYTGEYTNNIGTYLVFEDKEANNSSRSNCLENFDYTGKTYKKLVLTRLFVQEKEANQKI